MNEQDLEQQLKAALARKDPSPFFEARVLAAAKRQGQARHANFRMWWASAVAASLLIVTGSAWQYEKAVRERAAGEDAKARLELALKVTSVKLQRISMKVEGIRQN
jgi:hypothetical protein